MKEGGVIAMPQKKKNREEKAHPLTAKELMAKALELPQGIVPGNAHIELMGNREAVVEGCKSVLEYDETQICLNTGSGIVRFAGSDLSIRALNGEEASIEGFIATIEFTT